MRDDTVGGDPSLGGGRKEGRKETSFEKELWL